MFVMNVRNEVMSLIHKHGRTLKEVCNKVSIKINNPKFTQKSISGKFSQGTVRFEEIQLILKELGYRIEFVEDK